jgi:D-beta-D-heptose 7-phosphate kinase/D-beta-D-heptose 1-phosphate adenosyltransferase
MKILVIGDSCIDVFVYGKCDRLCPEAPVPVFIPTKKNKNGGMALNVYENLKSMNVDVDIITNKETITKTRYVDMVSNQLIVRVDSENKKFERVSNIEEIDFSIYDSVIISDYDKGFLQNEDIDFICKKHNKVFIDTKKIINNSFVDAFFIKINEHEYGNNKKFGDYIDNLKNKLIITLGKKGCLYLDKIFPVKKVEIRDMSGAGDTFLSGLVYKFILTNNIEESIHFANECSTIVVQEKGVNKIGDFLKL